MSELVKEQLVARVPKPFAGLLKGLIIAALVLLGLFGLLMSPLILILVVIAGFLVYYLVLPRFNVEYEYLYVNGDFDIDVIYSQQRRKRVDSFDLSDIEVIAPLGSQALSAYQHDYTVADYSSGRPEDKPYVFVCPSKHKLYYLLLDAELLKDLKYRAPRKVNEW